MKAVSIGFGVFMGIFPIWGFQLITAIAISIWFRLNKALVIIAANISIPPLWPLIIYLSHFTGKIWMGKNAQEFTFDKDVTFEFIHNNALQYYSGAITLAFIAGIVFSIVTYVVLKLFKRKTA